jgi:hypothetical protein
VPGGAAAVRSGLRLGRPSGHPVAVQAGPDWHGDRPERRHGDRRRQGEAEGLRPDPPETLASRRRCTTSRQGRGPRSHRAVGVGGRDSLGAVPGSLFHCAAQKRRAPASEILRGRCRRRTWR